METDLDENSNDLQKYNKKLSNNSNNKKSMEDLFNDSIGDQVYFSRSDSFISLRQSSSSLHPLVPVSSASSIRSLSSNASNTAKNELQASSSSTTGGANAAASPATAAATEKEKKRKEVSSSRVKKFHRHFSQVSNDEKLINYFSCALVSDILLQGHLYITRQHFAFYSNVFGYVTKVVIPTSSVTKISKEKTAKIIPNAVGVATADERHVFGSFISREAAYRLMCSVCTPMSPAVAEAVKLPADIEIEDYAIEDDSSCSVSGNEGPPQASSIKSVSDSGPDTSANLEEPIDERLQDIPRTPSVCRLTKRDTQKGAVTFEPGTTTEKELRETEEISPDSSPNASGTSVFSSSSFRSMHPSVQSLYKNARARLTKTSSYIGSFTDLQLIYLGIAMAVLLSIFSLFLLYRVINIEAKASVYGAPLDHPFHNLINDEKLFQDSLRWQKELMTKSSTEAKDIVEKNLEQISKVRRSLEALSMLIEDRASASTAHTKHKNCD